MQITEVKVFPVEEEKLKAFVSVVFDGCFMVNDIKVIRGKEGLFISMPSRRKKNGKFKDVAHPLNNDTRRMIEDKILEEYRSALGERAAETPTAARRLPSAGASGRPKAAPAPPAPPSERPPQPAPPRERPSQSTPPRERPSQPAPPRERPSQPAPPVAAEERADARAEPIEPSPAPAAEAAEPQVEAVPGAAEETAPEAADASEEKSLEEVTEIHLRDSFWST